MKQKRQLQKFCDFEQDRPILALAESIQLYLSERTQPDVPARALRRAVVRFESAPTAPPAMACLRDKFHSPPGSYTMLFAEIVSCGV